jgi:glycosyltransferase involved in cell wall biosynthesis
MKIALIRREYITHLDGVNRFIALLAESLRKLGHEVEIFSWCYRGVCRERLEEWFREIHGLDTAIPIHTLREGPCGGDPWARMALDWFFKGSRMLRGSGFDVVIMNGTVPLRFRPQVAVNHGITLNAGKLYLFAAKWLYKHYDKVICVSHRLREEVRNILGINCEIIPLPMKLELYKPRSINEREDMVIHIGARPVKNPHISRADMPNVVRIKLTTLDSLIESLGLSRVDIMKVDVEGHELEVLKECQNSLRKKLISKLIIEVHASCLNKLPEITQTLKRYKYKIDGILLGVLYARAK